MLTADPEQSWLSRAHESLDHGDLARAQRLLRKHSGASQKPELLFLRWRAATGLDRLDEALKIARLGTSLNPEEPDLQHALGWTLLALGKAEEAAIALEEACFLDRDFAEAWYDLALCREALGDRAGMKTAFSEVYALDTAEGQDPLRFSRDQVLNWAERAFRQLPAAVQEPCRDLPIFVQDYPDPWILESEPFDPRLLGLFDGPTWADLKGGDGVAASPHVYLYQRNLERLFFDPRDMAAQVRITLHHEVGHFLGLDEDDLHHRGLG